MVQERNIFVDIYIYMLLFYVRVKKCVKKTSCNVCKKKILVNIWSTDKSGQSLFAFRVKRIIWIHLIGLNSQICYFDMFQKR